MESERFNAVSYKSVGLPLPKAVEKGNTQKDSIKKMWFLDENEHFEWLPVLSKNVQVQNPRLGPSYEPHSSDLIATGQMKIRRLVLNICHVLHKDNLKTMEASI